MNKTLISLFLLLMAQTLLSEQYLYLSNGGKKEIQRYLINPDNGELSLVDVLKLEGAPGQLALSKDKKHTLFSMSTKASGASLITLTVDDHGKLHNKASKSIPMGGHGKISQDGKYFIQYHYKQNKVSVLKLKNFIFTGTRTDVASTTDHPHDVAFSNDGDLVFVPHNWDNRMYQYSLNKETGKLSPLKPPYISGPDIEKKGYANFRSIVNHPNLNIIYCTYEKKGGLVSLTYDEKGLKVWQDFSTSISGETNTASKLTLSRNKKFLFVSNRISKAPGSIAVFHLNPETGEILKQVGVFENRAIQSREINIDKTGKFLYSSSKQTGSTYLLYVNEGGSIKHYKEYKIGAGPMLILEK